jgi:hypothetical protein
MVVTSTVKFSRSSLLRGALLQLRQGLAEPLCQSCVKLRAQSAVDNSRQETVLMRPNPLLQRSALVRTNAQDRGACLALNITPTRRANQPELVKTQNQKYFALPEF